MGRTIREFRARPPAAHHHRPGHDRDHLRTPVRGGRVGARRDAGLAQRAVLARRRSRRALAAGDQPECVRGRWVHLALRRRGDEWRPLCRRGESSASHPAGAARRRRGRRRARAVPTPAARHSRRGVGNAAGRARSRHRLRHPAAARDRRHRRSLVDALPDPVRTSCGVLADGPLPSWSQPRPGGSMTTHTRSRATSLVLLTLVTCMSGCAVGPNFRKPAAPAVDRYTRSTMTGTGPSAEMPGGEAQRLVAGRDIPAAWWTLFESPPLNALVERALAASPTLMAAHLSLRQALELVAAQRGTFFPAVQAGFSPSYQRVSRTLSAPLSNPDQFTYSLYTAQVAVSFTPDVFGANRRQVQALIGQAEAQRFQREATYVTLTSNVVAAAINEASLRAQIAATQEIIRSEERR